MVITTVKARGHAKDRIFELFKQCAYARSERQCEFLFNHLKLEGEYAEITEFFRDLPKEKWCAALFGRDVWRNNKQHPRVLQQLNNTSPCTACLLPCRRNQVIHYNLINFNGYF